LTGNSASFGGGIWNDSGTPTKIDRSTLSGNSASEGEGGGIMNTGTATLEVSGSSLTGNSASFGGGIVNSLGSTVTVIGSALLANTARDIGGGILNYGSTKLIATIVFANAGSGIDNYHVLSVQDGSLVFGNFGADLYERSSAGATFFVDRSSFIAAIQFA
jgi:hypothetical protein